MTFVFNVLYAVALVANNTTKSSFSMREDGFEFDKWILNQEYEKPQGTGPDESSTTQVELQ